jgi:small subunit ribosomal protein S1
MAYSNPEQRQVDEALDAALKNQTNKAPERPKTEAPLKSQWDDDLEAELEAALQGFDAANLGMDSPRTRSEDRKHVPKPAVGQEAAPGMRQGKVVGVRGKVVFVDMGAKSEGIVPVEQFKGNLPAPGDMIDVNVDHFDTSEGLLILSLKGAAVQANWENLRKGLVVEARVTKTNKGGLDVEVDGIRGFLPIGQIDINRVDDAAVYVNQKLRVIVTEANQREKNLVVSRRELLEQERAELREKTWASIEEGQVRHGVVRSVKDFGAFVDLGGVDGLLHVGEMSWSRVTDVAKFIKVGQEVDVKILKIDRENRKLSLGLKQLTPSPWDLVEEKYDRGMTVKGKVTRVQEFGAFVELEPGIEGLIHISELSPNRVRRVSDIVKPEQEVEVRILKIEPEAKKMSLSLRPLPTAPAEPETEDEGEEDVPPVVKSEPKIPLKGGLGDHDSLFRMPPR